MIGTDRYKALTAMAVLLVAAIAAVISYEHVVALAVRYGQPPLAAYLLPVSIDGLVAVSSLVMLRAARIGVSAPWLARTGLVLAVIATVGCNIGYGVAHGWPGALLSGWPAMAFVVAADVAIAMTRRQPSAPAPAPGTPAPEPPAGLNGHAERAAEIFADDLAAGTVLGVRRLALQDLDLPPWPRRSWASNSCRTLLLAVHPASLLPPIAVGGTRGLAEARQYGSNAQDRFVN